MENSAQQKEDNNIEVVQNGNLSKGLVKKVNGDQLMVLNIKNPQACIQESLVQGIYEFRSKIPIQISTIDEIYLRRCVELVHFSAFPKRTGLISTDCTSDVDSFAIEYALTSAGVDDSILGTISRSQSMVNILKSPLFEKFGSIDMDTNSRTTSSSGGLSSSSTQNIQKKMMILGEHTQGSNPVHKRVFSVSSTNSTCSDISSPPNSNLVSHGILQCTWFEGNPHIVFSLEDQREVYVAKLVKKGSDYTYVFYSRTSHDKDSDIVGTMKVSTSLTFSPDNSQVLETQFVLFGFSDFGTESKTKGTLKKVGSIFRPGYLSRQRTSFKFAGISSSGTIQENSSWEPSQENLLNFQENEQLPNYELAAIVVKEHIFDAVEEPKIGGWGLNFLKKVGSTKIVSESCQSSVSDCSTSMDIIVPAGFHGGPRIRTGGPSSLIDRWHSGGRCDCGGWDLGCPIKLLKSNSNQGSTEFDIVVEGSNRDLPIMKMNGNDRLYSIHFQPPLSALQSFAIASAIIHSRSPTIRQQKSRTGLSS